MQFKSPKNYLRNKIEIELQEGGDVTSASTDDDSIEVFPAAMKKN